MITLLRLRILILVINVYETLYFDFVIKRALSKLKLKYVIDVGANKGGFIKKLLRTDQNLIIHAFEPNPTLFMELKEKFNKKSIFLNNLAVSDTVEQKTFYENIFHLTSSLEEPNLNSQHSQRKIKAFGIKPNELIKNTYLVNTITLSQYLYDNQFKKVDLLKIDTEGHEYECLKGLFDDLKVEVKYIQVEEHVSESHSKSSIQSKKILIDNNYKERFRIKHHLGKFYDVIYEKM
jgi:FkbM family methyltransferase